jgi:hypothetical protein
MGVPKSQKMSWSAIVLWSFLCGALVVAFAGLAVLTSGWWWNEYAFQDLSLRDMVLYGLGLFVAGTVLPMFFLAQVNWVEKEGPAEIADEIERKLKG